MWLRRPNKKPYSINGLYLKFNEILDLDNYVVIAVRSTVLLTIVLAGCNDQPVDVITTTSDVENPKHVVYENINNMSSKSYESDVPVSLPISCRNDLILNAYFSKQSSLQVKGCGKVVVLLEDDNTGSRHQRFIVELEGTRLLHTVLIAHNIDLAPKVKGLKKGDTLTFYGEYEYNPQGGVIHWTHHDPAARHQNGWIEYKGQRFM